MHVLLKGLLFSCNIWQDFRTKRYVASLLRIDIKRGKRAIGNISIHVFHALIVGI